MTGAATELTAETVGDAAMEPSGHIPKKRRAPTLAETQRQRVYTMAACVQVK